MGNRRYIVYSSIIFSRTVPNTDIIPIISIWHIPKTLEKAVRNELVKCCDIVDETQKPSLMLKSMETMLPSF